MEKEAISKSPKGRTARTPVAQRNVLTVKGKEPGYVYRVVNDTGDRIPMFEDAGYELVDSASVRVGDKRVERASPTGTKAEVSVGKGDKGYLMRIKKEFYEEDQNAKEDYLKRLEESTKQKALENADFGSIGLGTR